MAQHSYSYRILDVGGGFGEELLQDISAAQAVDSLHVELLRTLKDENDRPIVVATDGGEPNLEDLLGRTKLSSEQTLEIIAQVARGLAALHEHGMPHGNVSPRRIRIAPDGTAKLAAVGGFSFLKNESDVLRLLHDNDEFESLDVERAMRADIVSLMITLRFLLSQPCKKGTTFAAFLDSRPREKWAAAALSLEGLDDTVREALERAVEELEQRPDEIASRIAGQLEPAGSRPQLLVTVIENCDDVATDKAPIKQDNDVVTTERAGDTTATEQAVRSARIDAGTAAATMFLIPLLAVVCTFAIHTWRARSVLDPSTVHLARAVMTLPGQNGSWWMDDPVTFFLTPPIREGLVRTGMLTDVIDQFELPSEVDRRGYHAWLQAFHAKLRAHSGYVQKEEPYVSQIAEMTLGEEFLFQSEPFSSTDELVLLWEQLSNADRAVDLHLRAALAHKIGNLWQDRRPIDDKRADESKSEAADSEDTSTDEPTSNLAASSDAAAKQPLQLDTPVSKSDWHAAARRDYQTAIEKYYEYPFHNRDLVALCIADLGRLYLQQNELIKAAYRFAQALQLTDPDPEPGRTTVQSARDFAVDCLCQASMCYRRDGRWEKAERLLNKAQSKTRESSGGASAAAYVNERLGWLYMDAWQVKDAKDCFKEAVTYRSDPDHFPAAHANAATRLLVLHDRHGIAMATRYSGDPRQAAEQYAEILRELRRLDQSSRRETFRYTWRILDDVLLPSSSDHPKSTSHTPNSDNTQSTGDLQSNRANQGSDTVGIEESQLEGRVLNTLERYADCFVFGRSAFSELEPQRVLEATLKIVQSRELLGRLHSEQLAKTLDKLAMEKALNGSKDAGQLLQQSEEYFPLDQRSDRFAFLHLLAEAYANKGRDEMAKVLRRRFIQLRTFGYVSRDELDAALLAAQILFAHAGDTRQIDQSAQRLEDEHPEQQYAAILSNLARFPLEGEISGDLPDSNEEVLSYLRGAYVTAIRFELLPDRADVLRRLRGESEHLDPHQNDHSVAPLLLEESLRIARSPSRSFSLAGRDIVVFVAFDPAEEEDEKSSGHVVHLRGGTVQMADGEMTRETFMQREKAADFPEFGLMPTFKHSASVERLVDDLAEEASRQQP